MIICSSSCLVVYFVWIFTCISFSFLESGSDAIETATYQATIGGFVDHLRVNEEEAFALIRKGAELACQVRDHFWEDCSDCHQGIVNTAVWVTSRFLQLFISDIEISFDLVELCE